MAARRTPNLLGLAAQTRQWTRLISGSSWPTQPCRSVSLVVEQASHVVTQAMSRLPAPADADVLYIYLTGDSSGLSYAEAAERLSMTEAAVKMAVHRLRQRFQDAIRREIAQTVATQEDVDDEIQTLMAALQRPV